MLPRENALRSLLSETEFRALQHLARSSGSMTGRELSRRLGVSPTTASAAFAKLLEAGFATSEVRGRALSWQLNRLDPTITGWLIESGAGYPAIPDARPRMTVLLLTALGLEYAAISDHLDFEDSTYVKSMRFERATFEGESVTWDVYAAEIGMGNVFSGIVATAASERFKPHLALFVGVAGSVKPKDLCRGDVFLPDRVYELGAGKEIRTENGSELLLRPFSTEAPRAITQFARSVARGDWMAEQRRLRPDIEPNNMEGNPPRVGIRSLAASNRVLSDDESALVQALEKNFNDVAAVDMESLGFYQAAQFGNFPAVSIRGISDHIVDKTADADATWQPIAASHAASFAFTLLYRAGVHDVFGETEPPPIEGTGGQPRQPSGPTGPTSGPVEEREILYRLPPAVAVVHAWAGRVDDDGRGHVIGELLEHREAPGEWLDSLRATPQRLFDLADSPVTVFMVAEFAEAHEHPSAPWLIEQAADRSTDPNARALFLGRAAWSARRHGDLEFSDHLLGRARAEQPRAELIWMLYDAAFRFDNSTVVELAQQVASAMGLRLPGPRRDLIASDDALGTLAREWRRECPELLDLFRFHVAIVDADYMRRLENYAGALQILETLTDPEVGPEDGGVIWDSLVGPRGSVVPLETARTICLRIASSAPETGTDRDFELARAVELALTARDRRLDWKGPTSDPLMIAAEAKARAGDPRGALRLLLAPPRGTALPSESNSQAVVDLAPGIAYMTGDVQLTLELARRVTDPVERRITTALALATREDSHPEAASEFRAVLATPSVADRIDQRVRALLGLATVAELTPQDKEQLVGLDSETRDLILAQSMISGGHITDAQVLMRPHTGSAAELQITVEVLVSQGRSEDAISRLDEYATRHGEERLLLQAAHLALSAGLLERAEQLASRVSASQDAVRRRTSLEMQIDIAQQRGDWPRVMTETHRLLSSSGDYGDDPEWDSAKIRYRWARVNALYQERDAAAAYFELDTDPPLEASTKPEAMLIIAVLRALAHEVQENGIGLLVAGRTLTQRDVLRRAAAIARRFPDEEEVVAAALITSLSMPAEGEIDPEELIEARQLQDQFFNRFPESKLVQKVALPDSPEELAEMVGAQLAATAGPLEQRRKTVFVGLTPLSAFAAAAQRSYAEGLVQNAAGAYVLESMDPATKAGELEVARAALNADVIVDTSALFHAARVLGEIQELRNRFTRLILPASLRDDVLSARAVLARRSVGSFGWDPIMQSPRMTFYNEATTDRWAEEAKRLADAIPLCHVLPDAPYEGDPRNSVWSAAIRLAKDRDMPLIADDVALRHVARLEGVQAFGTLGLLEVLIEREELANSAMELALSRLQQISAADLPLLDRIQEIAEREEWNPTGYAGFLLTRPVTWVPPSKGLGIYMKLVHEMPVREIETISNWCAMASYGMAFSVPEPLVLASVGSLVAWTTLEWKGPEALPLLLEKTRRVVFDFARGADLLRDAVQRIAGTLNQIVPTEMVPQMVLRLCEGLNEDDRLKAVEYLISTP